MREKVSLDEGLKLELEHLDEILKLKMPEQDWEV